MNRDISWDFWPKFNVDIFFENLYPYVKKHALSDFDSTETLAPVNAGKIKKNRKFYGKNTVSFGPVEAELFFFRKWNFRHFSTYSQKN